MNLNNNLGTSKKTPFQCNICWRYYSSKGNLKQHMLLHSNEKTYSCNVCDKTFKQQSNLSKHKRTHSNEEPYRSNSINNSFLEHTKHSNEMEQLQNINEIGAINQTDIRSSDGSTSISGVVNPQSRDHQNVPPQVYSNEIDFSTNSIRNINQSQTHIQTLSSFVESYDTNNIVAHNSYVDNDNTIPNVFRGDNFYISEYANINLNPVMNRNEQREDIRQSSQQQQQQQYINQIDPIIQTNIQTSSESTHFSLNVNPSSSVNPNVLPLSNALHSTNFSQSHFQPLPSYANQVNYVLLNNLPPLPMHRNTIPANNLNINNSTNINEVGRNLIYPNQNTNQISSINATNFNSTRSTSGTSSNVNSQNLINQNVTRCSNPTCCFCTLFE